MQCRICATALAADARYCMHCGASVDGGATGATQRLDAYTETSMKDGRCPKCGSLEVYYQPQGLRATIRPQRYTQEVALQVGPHDGISIAPTVCTSCGYVEFYVLYQEDSLRIMREWRKLPL